MIKFKPRVSLFVLAMACIGVVSEAQAITFTASGTASDGRPENGQVSFSFNANYTDLLVTLTNTAGVGQLGGISSVLDGVKFTLDGVSLSALSLNTGFADASFNPNGTVNCTTGSCVASATPISVSASGWAYNSSSGLLSAGNGSFKPYGIVNSNLITTDGIPNAQHNPYLEGPVTFDFSITNPSNSVINVTSASLYFGTKPDIQIAVAVPEPETYAMLLAGLGLVGFAARRKLS
jgi:hypothetical protein